MAAYKDLVGQKITVVTSNPPEPKTGQMWYNSTDGVLRALSPTSAWRSSAPLIVARDGAGSAGTQAAAMTFGGSINPGNTNSTDEYNGSGFSIGGSLGTARRQTSGCGLQTAGLCVGGYTTANAANVEEYNGTSWSEQNDIPGNFRNGSTFGTQTAALYVGGYSAPVPNSTTIQIYDGTNWTTSPATLGTGGNSLSSTGTSTAGLVFGGSNRLNSTEEWNGSAMSTGGNMSTSKYGRGSAGQAPSENAMSAGGGIPAQTTVENYNGTSWSTLPSLAVATNSIKGAGTASSAMMMGGGPGDGTVFNTSTEFDESTNTITAAAWSSGGSLNTNRSLLAGAITSGTSGIVFGGSSPYTGKTESYNGTTWSELNDMNSARSYLSGFGTATAAVAAGGYFSTPGTPNVPKSEVEEWNGSSWSEETNLPASRKSAGNCGTLTAGLIMGGSSQQPYTSHITTTTFEYDGTNWTASGALPEGKGQAASGGTQTASFYAGGVLAPGGISSKTAFYNGSSWSEGANVVTIAPSSGGLGAIGTTSAGLATFGNNLTNIYDGTTWATAPSYSTTRSKGTSGATASDALLVAGYSAPLSPSYRAETEEFAGETTAANIANFTTS